MYSNMLISKFITLLTVFECRNLNKLDTKPEDVKDWIKNLIDDQAEAIEKVKRNLVSDLKSWAIVEPTERETDYVDDAMCSMFNLGTNKLIDNMEELEEFCHERNTYLVDITAWVIRKYTFHLNIRVFMNIALNNIRKKNDLYCASSDYKQNYIKFTKHLTQNNTKLNAIRFKFIDSLVSIQRSKIGITKIPNFCCAFRRYRNETLEAIDPKVPELRSFVADMIDSFFRDSINMVCLPFQINMESMCYYYPASHAEGQLRNSLLMNMVDAISKITYIVL